MLDEAIKRLRSNTASPEDVKLIIEHHKKLAGQLESKREGSSLISTLNRLQGYRKPNRERWIFSNTNSEGIS
jgi:hypothetical protein